MLYHITGNYPFHSLFREMVREIADQGIEQTVIVPLRNNEGNGINDLDYPRVRIVYLDVYRNIDRIFYFQKIEKGFQKVIALFPQLSKDDFIIAHTLFSDGGIAYRLWKKYGTPYTVCIRDTDLNYFLKYKPYLKPVFRKIVQGGDKTVFLSPCYMERAAKCFPEHERNLIIQKFVGIPNGVDPYWFSNLQKKKVVSNPMRLIFVGELCVRKNVKTILEAVHQCKKRGLNVELDIIGDGDQRQMLGELATKLDIDQQVSFEGWQKGKEKILPYYRNADVFIMPSLRETFGTVYIEAMTQGLPCIYTRHEGIDGWFEDHTIGSAVNPTSMKEITDAIFYVQSHYTQLTENVFNMVQRFQWKYIAKEYISTTRINEYE